MAILAYLVSGAGLAVLRLYLDQFDADEFQHAHIAWLISQGEVLYRDFWDNHGPIYAYLNATLLRLFGGDVTLDLLIRCRELSAIASLAIMALTFGTTRLLGSCRKEAVTAAALLGSLAIFRDAGIDCRPDPLQSLFWFAGLFVLLRNIPVRRVTPQVLAGLLFGLAVLTNTKAGLGPFFVLVFYVLGRRAHGLVLRQVCRDLLLLGGGAAIAYLPWLVYFLLQDAALPFHEFNTTWLLSAVAHEAGSGRGWDFVKSFGFRQLPFVVAAAMGVVFWIRRERYEDVARAARGRYWLFFSVAVGTAFSWLSNDYSQIMLITLPLWSVIAARGIFVVTRLGSARLGRAGVPAMAAAIVAAMAAMLWTPVAYLRMDAHPNLQFQKEFTRSFLARVPRSERIGIIWNTCGGYMFNRNVQYYWAAEPLVGSVVFRYSGYDPFGQLLVDALDADQTRYIVGRADGLFTRLPVITQDYIRKNYDYEACLWTRRADADVMDSPTELR